jgi:hypothetical protein
MGRFLQSQIDEVPSRVQPQRLTPALKHIPHIFVKKFKQPDT